MEEGVSGRTGVAELLFDARERVSDPNPVESGIPPVSTQEIVETAVVVDHPVEQIVPATTIQAVMSALSLQRVGPTTTFDGVVTPISVDHVTSTLGNDPVTDGRTVNPVSTLGPFALDADLAVDLGSIRHCATEECPDHYPQEDQSKTPHCTTSFSLRLSISFLWVPQTM